MTDPTPSPPAPPLACSLEPGSMQDRLARWQALADRALRDSARTTGGAWQRYRSEPEVERELRQLVALEQRCCPFLSFELTRRAGGLELDVRGPAGAAAVLDAFATGSRPLG